MEGILGPNRQTVAEWQLLWQVCWLVRVNSQSRRWTRDYLSKRDEYLDPPWSHLRTTWLCGKLLNDDNKNTRWNRPSLTPFVEMLQ